MKRFTKMLALGMTLAMVFGMAVNAASDNGSVITADPNAPVVATGSTGVTSGELTESKVAAGRQVATQPATSTAVKEALGASVSVEAVMGVYELEVAPTGGTVKFELPALGNKRSYVLLHYSTGSFASAPEVIKLVLTTEKAEQEGYYVFEAELTSGSPFVLARVSDDLYVPNVRPVDGMTSGVVDVDIQVINADNAIAAAKNALASQAVKDAYNTTIAEILGVYNFNVATTGTVTFELETLPAGQRYLLLHYRSQDWETAFAGSKPEVIQLNIVPETKTNHGYSSYYAAKLTSGSPFVLVRTVDNVVAPDYYGAAVNIEVPDPDQNLYYQRLPITWAQAEKGFSTVIGAYAQKAVWNQTDAGEGYVWNIKRAVDIVNVQLAENTSAQFVATLSKLLVPTQQAYAVLRYDDNVQFNSYPQVQMLTMVERWDEKYSGVFNGTAVYVIVELEKVSVEVPAGQDADAAAAAAQTTTPAAAPAAQNSAVSPKTGEAMPVAPIMALICLAGVVVCAKKVRRNG